MNSRSMDIAIGGGGSCSTCGKLRYLSRAAAKAAIRSFPGKPTHMRAYACGNYWHLGHLPKSVKKGRVPRSMVGPSSPSYAGDPRRDTPPK
jgi:hypothetical protein